MSGIKSGGVKPGVPAINFADPLSRGLVCAVPFSRAQPDQGVSPPSGTQAGGFLYPGQQRFAPATWARGALYGTDWVNCPYGKALDMSGAGARLVCTPSLYSFHNGFETLTVSLVAKLHSPTSAQQGGIAYGLIMSSAWDYSWKFQVHSSMAYMGVSDGANPLTVQHTLTDTDWHHFVFTYDGQTIRGYCDGAPANPIPEASYGSPTALNWTFPAHTLPIGASPLVLGARDYSALYPFYATVADFRYWGNRQLTSGEVADLYDDLWRMYRQPGVHERYYQYVGAPASGMLFEFDQLTGGMPDLRGGMV